MSETTENKTSDVKIVYACSAILAFTIIVLYPIFQMLASIVQYKVFGN